MSSRKKSKLFDRGSSNSSRKSDRLTWPTCTNLQTHTDFALMFFLLPACCKAPISYSSNCNSPKFPPQSCRRRSFSLSSPNKHSYNRCLHLPIGKEGRRRGRKGKSSQDFPLYTLCSLLTAAGAVWSVVISITVKKRWKLCRTAN